VRFLREHFGPSLQKEMAPLFQIHYDEASIQKQYGWDLNPNYKLMEELSKISYKHTIGGMIFYTARLSQDDLVSESDQLNQLVGYSVYLLSADFQCSNLYTASQALLFVHPDRRGLGKKLLSWCDEQLDKLGIGLITQNSNIERDWGAKTLVPLGYKPLDKLYGKFLY
jgi:GNAT superfamily N-acetyltransferase